MRESQVLGHGNGDDIPPGVDGRLLDGGDDLLGLSDADADLTLLVSDDDDCSEMQLLPSFDHLRDPPDLDHPLLEPISDLLLLDTGPEPADLLDLRVHDVDVVAQDADAAVGRAVELLVGGGDLVLRLRGAIVEGGRGDEALGGLGGRVDGVVLVGVVVGEEESVAVGRSGAGAGVCGLGDEGAGGGEGKGESGAGGDGGGGGGGEEREARGGVERERGERGKSCRGCGGGDHCSHGGFGIGKGGKERGGV